jgi:hypothetical protein
MMIIRKYEDYYHVFLNKIIEFYFLHSSDVIAVK